MASTSPYRTSSELVIEVLKRTGVLSPGQAIDADDFSLVNDGLESIFRKLSGLEIVFVADRDNIPAAWFFDLADIVVGESASNLGIVGQELNDLIAKGLGGLSGLDIGAGAAAKSLKIINRGRPTYEVHRQQSF